MLPDDVVTSILHNSERGLRLVDQRTKRCHDAQIIQLTIHGYKLSAVPNHFRPTHLVAHLTRHMEHLRSLKIT